MVDRRRALLVVGVCLVASVAVVGVDWYPGTESAVYEEGGDIVLAVDGERVETLGTTEDHALTTAEERGATLAAVYVPDSQTQLIDIWVTWSLPDGLWYDTRVEIEPAGSQPANVENPSSTRYTDSLLLGGGPRAVATSSGTRLDYPLGTDQAAINAQTVGLGRAHNETVAYEARLTARSLTGQSVDVGIIFETAYTLR